MHHCDRNRPDHAQTHDEDWLQTVVNLMVRTYCAGMDIDECVLTVHAHEEGRCHDRLLTLHVATGPNSVARLALHSVVADATSAVFAANADGGT